MIFPKSPLAHIAESRCETMNEHLEATRVLAGAFAVKFGLRETAETLARFHDLGKFSVEFQQYLRQSAGDSEETFSHRAHGPDHSTAGAKFLSENVPGLGNLFAYAIAGHHAGLSNGIDSGNSALDSRLHHKKIPEWQESARATLPSEYFSADIEKIFYEIKPMVQRSSAPAFTLSFLVRMAFSCLVDADFLATERFMNVEKSALREHSEKTMLPRLEKRLETYLTRFDGNESDIGKVRNEIREDCLAAATLSPGIFRLAVPTGGGKTLSSLAFALKHACRYGLERVIYAIPFTSIIEQNACVFREALGNDAVLEHHCNVEFPESSGEENTRAKLAAENWDSPLVVTTNVQFFESLFSHKPSRCRKLHNIAKSVVILDEAQTLPPEFLKPCLRALDELVQNYGTTIVLCTATQPAIDSEKLADGLRGNMHGIREIITPSRNLHERLKRVSVEKIAGTLDDEALANRLARERCVLAIVNTRKHARALFEKLRSVVPVAERRDVFHLSAQMCPLHRTEILSSIRARLADGEPCRVVSTQLVEAGVDVDFPCVYRASAGIDSIAQAAGRCNREGKLGGSGGRVFIFETDMLPPAGFLRLAADCGHQVLSSKECAKDPLSESAVTHYFELMYWRHGNTTDRLGVLSTLIPPSAVHNPLEFRFRDLGEKFRFIEESGATVLVPFGTRGRALCEALRRAFDPAEQRRLARALQCCAVNIPRAIFDKALADGRIRLVHDRYAILESTEIHYGNDVGIVFDDSGENSGRAFFC